MAILDNWRRFQADMNEAAERYHRRMDEIRVMAVSKTRSADEIRSARDAGLDLFGENRVGEAEEKFAVLDPDRYPLVLIGHLQSNKVARISGRFSAVHSVDSLRLAEKLSRHRDSIGAPLEVLIQVNTSGESRKSGFSDYGEFLESAQRIAELPGLRLKGVMTMAPFVDDESVVRRCFAECRRWGQAAANWTDGDPVLSMGMSSDFQWAVAEGSTMLRIGSRLFGSRE